MKTALEKKNLHANIYVGMRYWYPFTEEAIDQVKPLDFIDFFCVSVAFFLGLFLYVSSTIPKLPNACHSSMLQKYCGMCAVPSLSGIHRVNQNNFQYAHALSAVHVYATALSIIHGSHSIVATSSK